MPDVKQISSRFKLDESLFTRFNQIQFTTFDRPSAKNYSNVIQRLPHKSQIESQHYCPKHLLNSRKKKPREVNLIKYDSESSQWNPFQFQERERNELEDLKTVIIRDRIRRKYVYESIKQHAMLVKMLDKKKKIKPQREEAKSLDPFECAPLEVNLKTTTSLINKKKSNLFESPFDNDENTNKECSEENDSKTKRVSLLSNVEDKYEVASVTPTESSKMSPTPMDRAPELQLNTPFRDFRPEVFLDEKVNMFERQKKRSPEENVFYTPFGFDGTRSLQEYPNRDIFTYKNEDIPHEDKVSIERFKSYYLNPDQDVSVDGDGEFLKQEHKLSTEKHYLRYFVNHPEKIIPGNHVVFDGLKKAEKSPERLMFFKNTVYSACKRLMDDF